MGTNLTIVIAFVLLGCLSLLAAIANWDWYFKSPNVAIFLKWFGRGGARIFYAILGLLILVMAWVILQDTIY